MIYRSHPANDSLFKGKFHTFSFETEDVLKNVQCVYLWGLYNIVSTETECATPPSGPP